MKNKKKKEKKNNTENKPLNNKRSLKIDLSSVDCKVDNISVEIGKQVDENTFSNVLNRIGNACSDLQWQTKYGMCSTNDSKGTFIDTLDALKQLVAECSDNPVPLFVQVKY